MKVQACLLARGETYMDCLTSEATGNPLRALSVACARWEHCADSSYDAYMVRRRIRFMKRHLGLKKRKDISVLKNNHDLKGDVTINENAWILLHTSVPWLNQRWHFHWPPNHISIAKIIWQTTMKNWYMNSKKIESKRKSHGPGSKRGGDPRKLPSRKINRRGEKPSRRERGSKSTVPHIKWQK